MYAGSVHVGDQNPEPLPILCPTVIFALLCLVCVHSGQFGEFTVCMYIQFYAKYLLKVLPVGNMPLLQYSMANSMHKLLLSPCLLYVRT